MKKIDAPSQNQKILGHMRLIGSITQWEAYKQFRCTRLSGRIYDLKKAGYVIKHKDETSNGHVYRRYSLQ